MSCAASYIVKQVFCNIQFLLGLFKNTKEHLS